jgi:hypothetical protein
MAAGWQANVVANTPILSAWGNTIRDRTLVPFADTASRNAAIPAPTYGMATYVVGTGLQVHDGTTWVQIGGSYHYTIAIPGPWGPTSGGTAAILATLNIPAQSRAYVLGADMALTMENTVSLDIFQSTILIDGGTIGAAVVNRHNGANVPMNYSVPGIVANAVAAGVTKTVQARILRLAGTGAAVSQASAPGVLNAHVYHNQ